MRVHIWSGTFSKREGDPKRCRVSVADGGRSVTSHQCTRKPVVFRELDDPKGTFGFCKIHDPVVVAEKRRVEEARWQREWDERMAAAQACNDRAKALDKCIIALRAIEAGNNDPRALAREALGRLDAIGKD